ncbi:MULTISPECIES: Na+/H+ antiporter NhaC [unclassified Thalassotalea]|uniref:Na+/H+ antiporter NhaC n=1 Tax=unclassified Thalassotalea TaxID=2614972 RepID=UPI0010816FF2|nr:MULTISPECIES: Na+/H+ antiporter NhaC [unclassified Thalassotalea]NMP15535.1 Na+/H+ antiporter NhaC [Thalassotalea sp. Y01]QBY05818.1 Na+/H+ antiporter NhaC [Thalassotalea sp. HSM 43]
MSNSSTIKQPSLLDALIPVFVMIGLLAAAVMYFGDNSSYGPNQIGLLMATGVAIIIGFKNGHNWVSIEKAIINGISISLGAVLILLAVGSLIGTWLLAGTVPTLIYYGLNVLDPSWFYAATCIICGLVSMSIGSSWTTAATVGVALLAVAGGLELSAPITAGAIISGAYFGDKISPLSETTNLAPAVAGSELFTHIRYMLWTTLPSIATALVLFIILGLNEDVSQTTDNAMQLNTLLQENFDIGVFNLIPLVILLALAIKKVPAFIAVSLGAIAGAVWAVLFQQDFIMSLAGEDVDAITANVTIVWTAFFDGVSVNSGNANLDDLLSRGGMSGMLNTVWLIICALTFGAVLEHLGLLRRMMNAILSGIKSVGGLISSTVGTCIATNFVTADQYMAIVMPGRMYKEEYERRGLDPVVLSRTLEDSGTLTSPLIPWNSCGAYMHGVLAVNPLEYAFYCFFNLINPVLAVVYGFIGFKIRKLAKAVTA